MLAIPLLTFYCRATGRTLKWSFEVCIFEFFYLSPMMKFRNFQFKFGFRDPKLAGRDEEHRTLSNHKIEVIFLRLPLTGRRQTKDADFE